jgi:hypothetical protein
MKTEDPAALRFIMQDDIYLMRNDNNPVDTNATAKTDPVDFKYLGKHKKHFLVVVHYPDLEFIVDAHLTALESILKRKEIAVEDVAIFNIAAYKGADFGQVIAYFKPNKLLLLGRNALPESMPSITLNQPEQLNDCTALYSFGFDEMMNSNENKKAFWDQMKTL